MLASVKEVRESTGLYITLEKTIPNNLTCGEFTTKPIYNYDIVVFPSKTLVRKL